MKRLGVLTIALSGWLVAGIIGCGKTASLPGDAARGVSSTTTKTVEPAAENAENKAASASRRSEALPLAESRDALIYASRVGKRIEWALASSLDEDKIDHYEVLLSTGDKGVARIAQLPSSARGYDVKSESIQAAAKITIKAIEKRGHLAHLSNLVSLGRDIEISGLKDGQHVTAPIHVVATALSDQPVTTVQVSLDGLLVSSEQFDHIDAQISADPGARKVTFTGWDLAGNEFKKTITLQVDPPVAAPRPYEDTRPRGLPIVRIEKPSDNSTIATRTARLVVNADGPRPIVLVEVYRDDTKVLHSKFNHLDTAVPMPVGAHKITVKAYDKFGHISQAEVYVERLSESWAWDRDNLANPIR